MESLFDIIKAHLDALKTGEIPLIAILGPTAVGKTALSLEVAKRFDGEIISADSRQIYKYFNIGTDKISKEDMQGIPHHLIDFLEPTERFSAFDFKRLAEEKILEIVKRGRVPMLVGGTMMYIDAVLNDYKFGEVPPDENLRQELELIVEEKGAEALHDILKGMNPEVAATMHFNKVPYVIRAIEKEKLVKIERTEGLSSNFKTLKIGLIRSREEIYKRTGERIDSQMQDNSLVNEVKELLQRFPKTSPAFSSIGYRQIIPYLNGEMDLETAKECLKVDTRHFSKRQMTWWKKDPSIKWFMGDTFAQASAEAF